jgi:hypothetical protein
MAEQSLRFPTPWQADKLLGGYVVRDASGQALAYVYSRDNEAEARQAKVLTRDEARPDRCQHRATARTTRKKPRAASLSRPLGNLWSRFECYCRPLTKVPETSPRRF